MPQSHEILKHVHQITRHREQDLLCRSLLTSVEKILQTRSCLHVTLRKDGQLLACAEMTDGLYSASSDSPTISPEILGLLEEMLQASQESKSNVEIDGKPAGVEVIFHADNIFQFLVFTRPTPFPSDERRVLSGMLSIYENFQTLLNESQTDQLTGLANRKTFDSIISHIFDSHDQEPRREEVASERRGESKESEQWWLAMMDADDFKRVNDEFGHLYGDEILINLANLIRENFRHADHKFRFGGEEFVILLKARDETACRLTLERFLQNVRDHKFPAGLTMTLSVGVVEVRQGDFHVQALDQADQALYHSKREGKDQITFYENLVTSNLVKPNSVKEGSVDLF